MSDVLALLIVAFSCGALFKTGDAIADLIIEIIKFLFRLIQRKIKK